MALVLLTCSGLLLRSFEKVRSVNLGLRTDHMLTAHYNLPQQQYGTQSAIDSFNLSLLSKLQALPGVRAVGVTSLLPVAGQDVRATFTPEGYIPPQGSGLNIAWATQVMGDYFRAAGIPLLRGRAFTSDDDAHAPLVAIVNQTLAQHYWPGQDPIGKRLHRGPTEATTIPWVTVVGEIGDVKELAADVAATNQVYFPFSQAKADAGSFAPSRHADGPRRFDRITQQPVAGADGWCIAQGCWFARSSTSAHAGRIDGGHRGGGPGSAPFHYRAHH